MVSVYSKLPKSQHVNYYQNKESYAFNGQNFSGLENLEIPPNSIIHCLGLLFQVSDTGLRLIVGKKIDNDTYLADSDLYIQLNKLAFVEQSDVTSTPDAAPRKEGLLASAYRFMTAPFLVRTPSNVMTRNK